MNRHFLAASVMAIAGTLPVHAADAGTLDVRVRDISGSVLIARIAEMAGIAFVVGGELPAQRVSIDERSLNPQEWIERFAAQRKLATKTWNGIVLIASECRLAHTVIPLDLDTHDTVNLSYQNARVSTIVTDAFAKLFEGEPVQYPDEDANASLTVSVREVPIADAIAAVASVTGWEVKRSEGALAFTHARPPCDVAVAEGRPRLPPPEGRSCAGPLPQHRCEPLEHHDIERLRVLGQISLTGGPEFALVEAPDGVVYRIAKGHFIGLDHGLVKLIDDDGLTINEIVHDDQAKRWVERLRFLPYVR